MKTPASSSSGNSSSSSASDDVIDERKRKRMQSNRESARRSRMRKQKHLDDLTAQVAQMSTENRQILNRVNVTAQQYVKVEAENSILRAQMMELSQRLQSLNEIINTTGAAVTSTAVLEADEFQFAEGYLNNSWNLMGATHQPIMAATCWKIKQRRKEIN